MWHREANLPEKKALFKLNITKVNDPLMEMIVGDYTQHSTGCSHTHTLVSRQARLEDNF